MFHNISNPKWFGNWSRLEDDYLGNGGTDIADNFTFSKMEKTGGLFGSIIRLATAFPAFALLRDMDAFVFVSGRKIDALEDLSGLPLAGNCSGLDIDRILQRPKCLG